MKKGNSRRDGIEHEAQALDGLTSRQKLLRITNWENRAARAQYNAAELAKLCSVSLRHLERHFHEEWRSTPRKRLRELQCRAARDLIANGASTKAAAATVFCSSK